MEPLDERCNALLAAYRERVTPAGDPDRQWSRIVEALPAAAPTPIARPRLRLVAWGGAIVAVAATLSFLQRPAPSSIAAESTAHDDARPDLAVIDDVREVAVDRVDARPTAVARPLAPVDPVPADDRPKRSRAPTRHRPDREKTVTSSPVTTAAGPDDTDALARELSLLREADRMKEGGQPAAALDAIERHDRNFPTGLLAVERDVKRIDVLCALGRSADAARHGQRFLAEHRDSPYAAHVRRSCVGTHDSDDETP